MNSRRINLEPALFARVALIVALLGCSSPLNGELPHLPAVRNSADDQRAEHRALGVLCRVPPELDGWRIRSVRGVGLPRFWWPESMVFRLRLSPGLDRSDGDLWYLALDIPPGESNRSIDPEIEPGVVAPMSDRDVALEVSDRLELRIEDVVERRSQVVHLHGKTFAFSHYCAGKSKRSLREEQWTTMAWRVRTKVHIIICRERGAIGGRLFHRPAWDFVRRLFLWVA